MAISATITGIEGRDAVVVTENSDTEAQKKALVRAQYEKNYDTAIDRYKYYGTLRAVVTWAPLLIYLGIARLIVDDAELSRLGNVFVYTCIILIMGATFVVQRNLQERQNTMNVISQQIQNELLENEPALERSNWSTISNKNNWKDVIVDETTTRNKENLKKKPKWDAPSWALIFFYAVLLALLAREPIFQFGSWVTKMSSGSGEEPVIVECSPASDDSLNCPIPSTLSEKASCTFGAKEGDDSIKVLTCLAE